MRSIHAFVLVVSLAACGGGHPSYIDAAPAVIDSSHAPIDAAAIDARPVDATSPDATAPDATPADAMPTDANLAPVITSVVVDDGTREIAQGSQRTLVVTGENLAAVTSAMLGELPCGGSGTATTYTCQVRVGQVGVATPAGPRTLTVTSPHGTADSTDVITVTEIYASPAGDDATGHGTPAAPYRSLARALVGDFGETIHLAAGTYAMTSSSMTIWQDRTVIGAARDTTIIVGPGSAATGLFLTSPHATLTDVTVQGTYLSTNASAQAHLERVRLQSCSSYCLYMTGGGLTAAGLLVENTSSSAVVLTSYDTVRTSAAITGMAITGTSNAAVYLAGPVDVSIDNSTVTGASTSVSIGTGAGLRMRGTTLAAAALTGVELFGDPAALDLGTAASPGGNELWGSTSAVADRRPARAAADGVVLQLTGSHLNGQSFAPGTTAIGPTTNGAFWNIEQANNRLAF